MPNDRTIRHTVNVLACAIGLAREDEQEGVRFLSRRLALAGIAIGAGSVLAASAVLYDTVAAELMCVQPAELIREYLRGLGDPKLGPDDWVYPDIPPYTGHNALTPEGVQNACDWSIADAAVRTEHAGKAIDALRTATGINN